MKVHAVKSGNDTILYYARSIRIGKKTTCMNIKRIGKLSELKLKYSDPVAHFKEEAKRLTAKAKADRAPFEIPQGTRVDPSSARTVRLGYLFPQAAYYGAGLGKAMAKAAQGSKAEYDFGRIRRDLVIGRILDPLSKSSTYSLASRFPEKPDYSLHQVYRALGLAAEHRGRIEAEAYRGRKEYADMDTSVVYYDCTNFFFEAEEEDGFRMYGKSKENRPNPVVQMGRFLDRNGIPVSMCVRPGNTNEQLTMVPLEKERKERFGRKKFVVCADGGLYGRKNLGYNSSPDLGFVVTKSLKKAKKEVRERLMSDAGWKRFGGEGTFSLRDAAGHEERKDRILYKEEWFEDRGLRERVIVTYSPRLAEYQRSVRAGQAARALERVESGRLKRKANQNDARRFVKAEYATAEGEAAEERSVSRDWDRFSEESRYDGFYAVSTDLEDPAEEIIRINKGRWEIEESFRIRKGEFKARPVYLSREDRIKAHFLVCFLALAVLRVIEQKLARKGYRFTVPEIISSLRGCNAVDRGYFYAGAMEGKAIGALEDAFGLKVSYAGLGKRQVRSLLSDSKKQASPRQGKENG